MAIIGSLEFYDKILYVNKLSEIQEGTYTLNFSKILENRNTNIKKLTYSGMGTYNGEYKYHTFMEESTNVEYNGVIKYDGKKTYKFDESYSILYFSQDTLNHTFSFDNNTLSIRLNGILYENEYWLCKSPFDSNYVEVYLGNTYTDYLDILQNAKLLAPQESLLLYYKLTDKAYRNIYFCYDNAFNSLKGIYTTYDKWIEDNSNLSTLEIENNFKNLTYNKVLASNKEDVKVLKYMNISSNFYMDRTTYKVYNLLDKTKFGEPISQHKIYKKTETETDELYPKQFNQTFEFSKEYLNYVPLDSSYSYYNFSIASNEYIKSLELNDEIDVSPLEINYCIPQNFTKLDLTKHFITYYGKVKIPRKIYNGNKIQETNPYANIINEDYYITREYDDGSTKENHINDTRLVLYNDLDNVEDGVSHYGLEYKNFNFSISTNSLLMLYDPIISSVGEWGLKKDTRVSIDNKTYRLNIHRNNCLFSQLNLKDWTNNNLLFTYMNFIGVNARIINYEKEIPKYSILEMRDTNYNTNSQSSNNENYLFSKNISLNTSLYPEKIEIELGLPFFTYSSNKYLGYIPPKILDKNNDLIDPIESNSIEITSDSSKEHYIKIIFKSFENTTSYDDKKPYLQTDFHSNTYGLKITYNNSLYFIPINNNSIDLQKISREQEIIFYLGEGITKLELVGGLSIKLENANSYFFKESQATLQPLIFDYNISNKYQLSITSARLYQVQYVEYFVLENYNEISFLDNFNSIPSSSFKIYTKKDKSYTIDMDRKNLNVIANTDKIQEI